MKTDFLRNLKDKSKLTTKQISDLSGIPESTISRILSGQTDNPSFDTVCALVKAMGGSLDELAEIREDSAEPKESQLDAFYEKVIAEKNWYIKVLMAVCGALVAVLVFIVIYDVTNGSVGFIRY